MKTVIVTGGIAMGKSSVCRLIRDHFPGEVAFFDADARVHELLTQAPILAKIRLSFGDDVITPDGQLDRSRLRKLVFDSANRRAELESILHPEVRKGFSDDREEASLTSELFLADIPLFFESKHPYPADTVLTVASSPEVQRKRVQKRTGLAPEEIKKIIDAQLPIETKIARADAVIFNDGSPASLERQTKLFIQCLTRTTPS